MIKKTILLLSSFLLLAMIPFSGALYPQDGVAWLDYGTRGNPKTAGHNFTLKYPSDYEKATDFSKDEYLQTFIYSDEEGSGDSILYLTVGIQDLPKNIDPATLQANGNWDTQKLEELWKTVGSSISGVNNQEQAVGWGNIPMAKYRVYQNNGDIASVSAMLFALHKDKLIKLECGYDSMGGGEDYGSDLDYTKDPTCVSYFSSLTFTE